MNRIEYVNGKIRMVVDMESDICKLPSAAQAGDASSVQIAFEIGRWKDIYGTGTYTVNVQRPYDDISYERSCTIDGDLAIYNFTTADLQYYGLGKIQLKGSFSNSVVKMSKMFTMEIGESLIPDSPAPSPWDDFLSRATASASTAAQNILSTITASGEMVLPSQPFSVIYNNESNNFNFQIPRGEIYFGTFNVSMSTGLLTFTYASTYAGPQFSIDDDGMLVVSVDTDES